MRFCRKNNLSPYFWTHRGCRATDVTAHGGSAERRQGHGMELKASPKVPYSTFYIYTRACARGWREVAEPRLRPAGGWRGLPADKEKAATPVGKCCGSYRDW